MSDAWPKLLTDFKRSNYSVRLLKSMLGGKSLFSLDLSDLKLRFSDSTPVIWIPEQFTGLKSTRSMFEDICDLARAHGGEAQGCIVLFDAVGDALKALTSGWVLAPTVVFDSRDQSQISKNLPHRQVMLDRICQQLSISSLAPYSYGQAVTGNQFFGRQTELAKMLHHHDSSFAITSGRRLGKTCLINELKRRLTRDPDDEKKLIYVDCSVIESLAQFFEALVLELNLRWLPKFYRSGNPTIQFLHLLKTASRARSGRVTFFLDEFDRLLENLDKGGEKAALLSTLRSSINSGSARYILAGFVRLQEAIRRNDSALYLGVEPMELKPFQVKETEEAVLRPMSSLKVRVENEKLIVSNVHSATRGHPLFVQFYCSQLITLLDQPNLLTRESRPLLTLDHLAQVSASPEFTTFLTDTFLVNAEAREKLLVYAILNDYGIDKVVFSQRDVAAAVDKAGPHLSPEQVEESCRVLVSSAVFDREEKGYCFAMKALPEALNVRFQGFEDLLLDAVRGFQR